MSLEDWRVNGLLSAHQSSPDEIKGLLAVADRDLADCQSREISTDWRFNIAYNALLQSATAALAAAGYRAGRDSHHYTVLQSLEFTLGCDRSALMQLDGFRKKRNMAGYERIGAVSDREVAELTVLAKDIRRKAEAAIRKTHPELL